MYSSANNGDVIPVAMFPSTCYPFSPSSTVEILLLISDVDIQAMSTTASVPTLPQSQSTTNAGGLAVQRLEMAGKPCTAEMVLCCTAE